MTSIPDQAKALIQAGKLAEAETLLEPYLKANPIDGSAWFYKGHCLFLRQRIPESVESYRTALRLQPENADIYVDLGAALTADQRLGEAEALLREAMRRNPQNALPAFTLANLCSRQRRYDEAEKLFRSIIAGAPDNMQAVQNLCAMLIDLNQTDEAIKIVNGFLARHPDHPLALSLLAIALDRAGKLDEALSVTQRAISIAPPRRLEMQLASYMSLVGRTGRLDLRADVLERVRAATQATLPGDDPRQWLGLDANALRRFTYLFPYYGINDRDLLKVHGALGRQIATSFPPTVPFGSAATGRLRIGYLSYNFGNHPIGHLLSVFFEAHGHERTELFLYGLQQSSKDVSGYGPRIRATADHFRDCRNKTDQELAAIIRADNLHVLIDLDGYLHGGRPEVLSMRPARVQIHWLQSLAGMPAPFIDYTIVDKVIVPENERNQGNGPLIRLADAFQCGEKFDLPPTLPSRASQSLPETGFVYCAFGNWLKIDEEVFTCWMEILKGVPDSILWLSNGPTSESITRLRQLAQEHGVDPTRLVLAPRTDAKRPHIDRHRLAGLFLDTFTFSAATTTTDALSAGLPVLTRRGATAQGRLSESLIRATGPTDLIVATREDYVATAIRLAHDPEELEKHRQRLAAALNSAPLFDANRMVRQFEVIYAAVWERFANGKAPMHIDVNI